MKFKMIILFLTGLLIISCFPETIKAQSQKKPTILILYDISSPVEQTTIHRVDALLSSYGETIVESRASATEKQIKQASTVIYIGMNQVEIPKKQREWINNFSHQKLFIGYNANQFNEFNQLKFNGKSNLVKVGKQTLAKRISFLKTTSPYKKVIEGQTINGVHPVLLKNDKSYYLSLNQWTDEFQWYLQPYIAENTTWFKPPKHKAWIIISGIQPSTSPKRLKQTTDILKKRQIPYALAIAAVEYTNNQKGINKLEEAKELKKELQNQQAQGVPIIANGYGLSYRMDDKVQHEFWDSRFNQPITALNSAQAEKAYSLDAFSSIEAFNKEREKIGRTEKEYTAKRIEDAITELVNAKLYPIAFTIENDHASSYVYEEISKHFSLFFGALQYNDNSSEDTGVQPLITKPAYMNHLQVYSTNIKPVINGLEGEPTLVHELKDLLKIKGSMAGIKINMQLNPKTIERTLDIFESFPQFEWQNLREVKSDVQIKHITIQQTAKGALEVKQQKKYLDFIKKKWQTSPFEFSLWVLFWIVFLFVLIFFLNVIRLRFTLKKRLFEERKPNG